MSSLTLPLLALDVGDVRIGVAASASGIVCSPLPAIHRKGRKQTLDALEAVAGAQGAKGFVLGLPLREGGGEGEQVEKTRAFARSLARRLPRLPIAFWDERYSSADAKEILGPGPHAPGVVDSLAACVILQEYLDHHFSARDSADPDAGEDDDVTPGGV